MKTLRKKAMKITLLLCILIQIALLGIPYPMIKANIKEGDILALQGDHECDSLLEYWMEDYQKWSYKIVWYVYYIDKEEGKKYPAFCIQPEREGIGTGYETYDVSLSKENDPVIWRILHKGYMGSNYQSWNLECDDDFYTATKVALHSYAQKVSPKEKYIVGNRPVDGNSIEEIQRRGSKVLEVAQALYTYGITGTQSYTKPEVHIQQQGEKYLEEIDNVTYYVQPYKVTANHTLKDYQIRISNQVEGTKILNLKNEEIRQQAQTDFKVAVPVRQIKQNEKINIFIEEAVIKTNPVYYCKSHIEKAQNYITYTAGWETANTATSLSIRGDTSKLELLKVDAQTKKPMAGVSFSIFSQTGEKIGEYTTNQDGKILVDKLFPQIVTIKEVKTNEDYVLDEEERQVLLEWGKTSEIVWDNTKKRGDLKMIKVDKENPEIRLEKVEFELIDRGGNLITHMITDEKGEAYVNDLPIGIYTIREIKTKQGYEIATDTQIVIEWNKLCTQIIENVKKKGQIEVYKVDKEDRAIPIKGVKFEVKNDKQEIVDTIITNEQGKAITKALPIGLYYLQEVETNAQYVLQEEAICVEVKEKEVSYIQVENEKIKGKIKIIKTSQDDNLVNGQKKGSAISNVKFEIRDKQGNLKDRIITNQEGIAQSKWLEKGIYLIKEIEAGKDYELNTQEIETTIEEHLQVIVLEIQNKSMTIKDLPKTGY